MITNNTGKRVAGFTIATLFLVVASDFEPVAPIAVAFAWLVFIGLALTLGPGAFANLSNVTGKGNA